MTTYLIQILFGATLLLLVALVVNALLCKAAASLRHRVWTCTLLGLLALPMLSPVLPTMYLAGIPAVETTNALQGQDIIAQGNALGHEAPQMSAALQGQGNEVPVESFSLALTGQQVVEETVTQGGAEYRLPWAIMRQPYRLEIGIAYLFWLLGTSILLIHLILSIHNVRKMLSSLENATDSILDELLREFGIKRPVRLVRNTTGSVPFITGIFRPTIVLPPQSEHWSIPERRAVLTHELAHVVRNDLFWQLLTQIVCALYWFHPLVWFAAYRIWIERESACDDTVVLRGEKPSVYADLLLELANTLRKQRLGLLGCTVAMTRKNNVRQRILAILNPNLRRLPLGRTGTAVFLCVAVVAIVLTATLSPFAQTEQNADPDENAKKLAIAVMQDAPLVTISGSVFLPDGSPADYCYARTETVAFVLQDSLHAEGISCYTSQGGDTHSVHRTEGTFQIEARPGTNVVLTISAAHFDAKVATNPNKRFATKPIVFVAREDMAPLKITLEEGIPLRGKVMYDNGTPAADRGFTLVQQIVPAVGENILEMQKLSRSLRWCPVNETGEFEIFLPPGDYTIDERSLKETFTIANTDKEKRLDLTMPTPIFVEVEMPDGTPAKNIWYFSTDTGVSTSREKSSLVFDPVSKDSTLYVTAQNDQQDRNGDYGMIAALTPAMAGTKQKLTLQPVGKVTVMLVDASGNPVVGERVSLLIVTRSEGGGTVSMGASDAVTDAAGKAVLRVPAGQVSVSLRLPGSFERPVPTGGKEILNKLEHRLDLTPGSTLDLGTITLTKVFKEPGTDNNVPSPIGGGLGWGEISEDANSPHPSPLPAGEGAIISPALSEEEQAKLHKDAMEKADASFRRIEAAMYGIPVVDADGNDRPTVDIQKDIYNLPQETPLLDIHVNVFMPDGSPADFRYCGIHYDTIKNNATTKGHPFAVSKGGHEIEKGTFRLQNATIPGANVMVMVCPLGGWYRDEPEKINRRFVSKPVTFIASENMEPVNITLEEGVPLRGKVMYKNGMPIAKHPFSLTQRIKRPPALTIPFERPANVPPELNARLDEYEQVGASIFVTRYYFTNDEGEYEIYLLPGEYSVESTPAEQQQHDRRNWNQAFSIAKTDKDKQYDITLPTPIFVEVENEDGSPMEQVSYLFLHQGRTHGSGDVYDRLPAKETKGSFNLDPITSGTGLLYLFDDCGVPGENKKYGTIETITPEMAGQTVRFKLKAPASVAVTLVDTDGKPMAEEKVEMVLLFHQGNTTYPRRTDSAVTDAEGKAVLRVVPGRNITAAIQLPDRYVPTGQTSGGMPIHQPYRISRALDLASGETLDLGTVEVDMPQEPGTHSP